MARTSTIWKTKPTISCERENEDLSILEYSVLQKDTQFCPEITVLLISDLNNKQLSPALREEASLTFLLKTKSPNCPNEIKLIQFFSHVLSTLFKT